MRGQRLCSYLHARLRSRGLDKLDAEVLAVAFAKMSHLTRANFLVALSQDAGRLARHGMTREWDLASMRVLTMNALRRVGQMMLLGGIPCAYVLADWSPFKPGPVLPLAQLQCGMHFRGCVEVIHDDAAIDRFVREADSTACSCLFVYAADQTVSEYRQIWMLPSPLSRLGSYLFVDECPAFHTHVLFGSTQHMPTYDCLVDFERAW